MGALITVCIVSLVVAAVAGLIVRQSRRQELDRLAEQTRLKVIEAQLVALQTALRIRAAEHQTVQRIRAEVLTPDFGGRAEPEQPWLS